MIGFAGVVAPSGAPKQSIVESDYLIQIGAFRNKEGANRFAQSNMNVNNRYNAVVKEGSLDNEPIYNVWLKGFDSRSRSFRFYRQGSL